MKLKYNGKKKFLKVLRLVLIFILIFFIINTIATIDSIKQTKENAKKTTELLMNSITEGDYEKIKLYISKIDGTELSDEQISNFLLNTGLYRAIIGNHGIVSFDANTSFLNSDKVNVIFSYKTLSGEIITNDLEYSHSNGLMTDNIQESNKIKERLPIATDLANGENIKYDDLKSNSEEDLLTIIVSYVKDNDGKVCIDVIEEAKQDLKIKVLNNLYSEIDLLKKNNENYNIVWNNEYTEFSVYYNEEKHNSIRFGWMRHQATIMSIAATLQCLDGNEDWRLTINYYDYDNNKLLKTETIR